MKPWVTGGLILSIIMTLLLISSNFFCTNHNIIEDGGDTCSWIVLLYFPSFLVGFMSMGIHSASAITGFLFYATTFIFYFIIGALLGWLIERYRR